jgi:hypothetical protein
MRVFFLWLVCASVLARTDAACEGVKYVRTCGMFNSNTGIHTWWPTPVDSEFACAADLTTREVDGTAFGTLSGNTTFLRIDLLPGVSIESDIARGFIRDGPQCSPIAITDGGNGAEAVAVFGSGTDMFQLTFATCIDLTVPPGTPGPPGTCNAWQDRRSVFCPRDPAQQSDWDSNSDANDFKWSNCPASIITNGALYLKLGGDGSADGEETQIVEFHNSVAGEVQTLHVEQTCGLVYTGAPYGNLRGAIAEHIDGKGAVRGEVCYRVCSDFTPNITTSTCEAWAHHRALAHVHNDKDSHWYGTSRKTFPCPGNCPATPNIYGGGGFVAIGDANYNQDVTFDVIPNPSVEIQMTHVEIYNTDGNPTCRDAPLAPDGQSLVAPFHLDDDDYKATVCVDECTNVVPTPNGDPPVINCLNWEYYRSRFNPTSYTDQSDWKTSTSTHPRYYTCSLSVCPSHTIVTGSLYLLADGDEDTIHTEVLPGINAEIEHFCVRKPYGPYVDGVVSTNLQEADAQYIDGEHADRAEVCYRVCTEIEPSVNVTINLPPFVNNETFSCVGGTIVLPGGWLASTPPNTVFAVLGPACTMTLRCGTTPIALAAPSPPRYDILGANLHQCIVRGYTPLTFAPAGGPNLAVTESDLQLVLDAPAGFGTLVTTDSRLTGPGGAVLLGNAVSWTGANLVVDGTTGLQGNVAAAVTLATTTIALSGELITGTTGPFILQGPSASATRLVAGQITGDASLTVALCVVTTAFGADVTGDFFVGNGSLIIASALVVSGEISGHATVLAATVQGVSLVATDVGTGLTLHDATLTFSGCIVPGTTTSITATNTVIVAQCGVAGAVPGVTSMSGGGITLTDSLIGSSGDTVSLLNVLVVATSLCAGASAGDIGITEAPPNSVPPGAAFSGALVGGEATNIDIVGANIVAASVAGASLTGCLRVEGGAQVSAVGAAVVNTAFCLTIADALLSAAVAVGGQITDALTIESQGHLLGGIGAAANVNTVTVTADATVNITGTFVVGDVTQLNLDVGSVLHVGVGFAGALPHFSLTGVTIVATGNVVSGTTPTLDLHGCLITAGGAILVGGIPTALVDDGSSLTCTAIITGNTNALTLANATVIGGRLVQEEVVQLAIGESAVNTTQLARVATSTLLEFSVVGVTQSTSEPGESYVVQNSTLRATGTCVSVFTNGTVNFQFSALSCGTILELIPP